MIINKLPEAVKIAYKANIVPFIWGPRGVGKSEAVATAAKEMGIKLIDVRLGQMEVGDLIGIPRVKKVNNEFVTVWGKPCWWPENGKGIIFFDEFNRAQTNDVIQAMFQLMLVSYADDGKKIRKMHTHILPDGWFPVCAGNPDTSDYVVQALDTSMLDRFVQIAVQVNKNVSVAWMQQNLVCDDLWKFVSTADNSLGKPEHFSMQISPSPRSYKFIDDIMAAMTDIQFDEFGVELLQGIIGEDLGLMCYQYLKENMVKPIPADRVINVGKYHKTAKNVDGTEKSSWDKFVEKELAKYLDKDATRLELLNVTCKDILNEIKKSTPTQTQVGNIIKFLDMLPGEMKIDFIAEALQTEDVAFAFLQRLSESDTDAFKISYSEAAGFDRKEIDAACEKLETIIEEYKKTQFQTTKK